MMGVSTVAHRESTLLGSGWKLKIFDSFKVFKGTLLVPNYHHIVTVKEQGKRLLLEGYHEHNFAGKGVRILYGEARELAFDKVIFEKWACEGAYRVTEYIETVWKASELPGKPEILKEFS